MDIRGEAANDYDEQLVPFDDVRFYKDRIPSADGSVLKLGCGTGRVLVPLAGCCGYVHGIDSSEASRLLRPKGGMKARDGEMDL